MTPDQAKDVVKFLFAGFPAQVSFMNPNDMKYTLAFYAAGLADLDHDKVRAAIVRLCRTADKIPTVAAIRAAIGVVTYGNQPAGAEAWGEVIAAIRSKGSHRQPGVDFHWSDPITARVVSALNWQSLCSSTNSHADRARFIEAYDYIARTERREAQASTGATNRQLERGGGSGLALRSSDGRTDRDGGVARGLAAIVGNLPPPPPPKEDDDAAE